MTTPSVDGETLLTRLNALFTEDPAIDEIGLLFGIEAEDLTLDDGFQLAEHKLGVAFSAGPLVFRAARARFHTLNAKLHAGEICDRENPVFHELLVCTRAILLISADFYTAWNTRKEFVRRGWLTAIDDVTFTSLVFSLHPKSIDTWAYRRWLATRLMQELTKTEVATFFEDQINLCGVLTERFPRNYHAWSFRHWIVSRFEEIAPLQHELVTMQKWCETHLTDHSGWNHRQHVIKCLLHKYNDDSTTSAYELLVTEFDFLSRILASYPMYEALWCHRRFIMQTLLAQVPPVDGEENDLTDLCDDVLNLGAEEESDGWLKSQFARARLYLAQPRSLYSVALQDVATAWRCGNRFARRYAAWVVQRLLLMQSPPSVVALERLNQAMRVSLAMDDALLDHLWRSVS